MLNGFEMRFMVFYCRSESESGDDEIADEDVTKLLIVTQTPPHARLSKHPGGDRTGSFQSRAKMSSQLAEVINDGLLHYEAVSGSVLTLCYLPALFSY